MAAQPQGTPWDSYRGFCTDTYQDGNGGYTQPYQHLLNQAQAEFNQLTPAFKATLHRLIQTSNDQENALQTTFQRMSHEYRGACHVWNALTLAAQQTQRGYMREDVLQIIRSCEDVDRHYAQMLQACRTTNVNERARVQSQYRIPHAMELLTGSLAQRRTRNNARLMQVRRDQGTYRNPVQIVPSGTKQLGKHRLPAVLFDVHEQQTLPPFPSVASYPFVTALFALPSHAGRTWRGAALGEGGMGATKVWIETDHTGAIYDRKVIKDSNLASSADDFRTANNWHGNIQADDWQATCVPLEWHLQNLASVDRTMNNIVRTWGVPRVDWQAFSYRMIMEYAEEGDLGQVISRHQEHQEPIPEKFVWLCFQALMTACMAMKHGAVSGPVTPWSEIVHCDLKPDNVFLDRTRTTYYPQFPTPQLGDFGLAFMTSTSDITNPFMWASAGTVGHYAPEQRQYIDSVTGCPVDAVKMLSPCNVYGVGTILFSLMEQRTLDQHAQPSFLPGVPPAEYKFDILTVALYSQDLRQLVERCLHAAPNARPTVEELKSYTDGKLWNHTWAVARGGDVGPTDDTLLLPKEPVKLKWASRMLNGPNQVDAPRQQRVPGSTSTQYSE